jgi:hypothetical protein
MFWLVLSLLLLVPAGDGFGQAVASAEVVGTDRIRVEVEVAIEGAGSAVAHLIEPGEDQQTVSLADRGGGEFGAVFESRQVDLVVVFEVLGDDPRQSMPLRLTDLGVEREVLGMSPPLVDVEEPDAGENSQWGWLGLGLGAAALSLLAVWVLVGSGESTPAGSEFDQNA